MGICDSPRFSGRFGAVFIWMVLDASPVISGVVKATPFNPTLSDPYIILFSESAES